MKAFHDQADIEAAIFVALLRDAGIDTRALGFIDKVFHSIADVAHGISDKLHEMGPAAIMVALGGMVGPSILAGLGAGGATAAVGVSTVTEAATAPLTSMMASAGINIGTPELMTIAKGALSMYAQKEQADYEKKMMRLAQEQQAAEIEAQRALQQAAVAQATASGALPQFQWYMLLPLAAIVLKKIL